MDDLPLGLLFGFIALLILISGFFSGSETSMLSLNRYRLKHLSKQKNKAAERSLKLLDRPERLIGVILIGNNLVNILASSIATVIAIRLFGDAGIAIATLVLTLVILIFAEITPKTIAALYPERFAFPASSVLKYLLILLSPVVWLVNNITSLLLMMLGLDPKKSLDDQISAEELRTIVDDAGDHIPDRHQSMLLNILDLESATVEDIMIPRGEIFYLNLDDNKEDIVKQLQSCEYTRIPVCRGEIDDIIGILHMRNLGKFLTDKDFSMEDFETILREPVYTPVGTGLHNQLMNFQKEKRRLAVVVDEYGDVHGLVTLEDILEEIVGEFTSNILEDEEPEMVAQNDGSFIISGSESIRDINKATGWDLPIDGPKTLNGLVQEQLESFPEKHETVSIGNCTVEILEIDDNVIDTAKVYLQAG